MNSRGGSTCIIAKSTASRSNQYLRAGKRISLSLLILPWIKSFFPPEKLGQGAMSRTAVWYMVRRRAADAGIETAIGCHTFRATGITDYLTNGGRIEVAQRMAGHSNAKTTGLYDRRNDDISVGEVERIGI